jgi:hypothetical protein
VIHARADALFGLGIVTGIAPAKGMQPDKHHSLFLSSALFDLNLTTRGRSSCSSRLAAGSMGASPWLMRLLTAASAAAHGATEPVCGHDGRRCGPLALNLALEG